MLKKLTVSNLAVVEKAEAEFAPGLNVLTGETGAGKSVLMGALGLVLGGRADASVVRDGAKEAEVEAIFEVEGKGGGGERVSIRRTVTREGRSRAWVNDESVSVAELKELGRTLVDIHGPTANQKLMEEAFQRETLDSYAEFNFVKNGKAISESGESVKRRYGSAFSELAGLKDQASSLMSATGEEEIDLLRFQVSELEEAGLSEEDETIAERHAAAAHAEDIVENANAITEALGGDQSAAEILIQLQPRFREIAKHLPSAAEWAAEAEELTLKVQELSRTVADAASKMDVGEEDLEELDKRLTMVNRLKRKYLTVKSLSACADNGFVIGSTDQPANRPNEVEQLLAVLANKKAKLDALEHREERLAELEAKIAVADRAVRAAGAELTKLRTAAAEKLSSSVTKELRDLGFLQAKFFVALEPIEPEAHGMDRVVYMFEPNPGEAARPLAAIASSGEIARVMLAIKCVEKFQVSGFRCQVSGFGTNDERMAANLKLETCNLKPTLVFDEIDANIGGEVGKIVGEKMRAVARRHQVIAITHLPQSAVYGDRHLVVSKTVSGGRTRTRISEVEGEDRVSEVARMLGGEKLTTVVRKHAEELLQLPR